MRTEESPNASFAPELLSPLRFTDEQREAIDLAVRFLEEKAQTRTEFFHSPYDSKNYFRLKLAGELDEHLLVSYLNNRHRLILTETEFKGTINRVALHPRPIVRRCLELNAAAVVVAHNHPADMAEPSREDRISTLRLEKALQLIDVKLLDHIVVATNDSVSFFEQGWL